MNPVRKSYANYRINASLDRCMKNKPVDLFPWFRIVYCCPANPYFGADLIGPPPGHACPFIVKFRKPPVGYIPEFDDIPRHFRTVGVPESDRSCKPAGNIIG